MTTKNDVIGLSDFKIPILKIPKLKSLRNAFGEMIHYREFDGHTTQLIVAVHGMGGDSRYLTQLGVQLAQKTGAHILLPDLKFHGENNQEKSVHLLPHQDVVFDLDFLLEHIKAKKNIYDVVLIGHSLGGAIALRWLLGKPARTFKKIVLIAPYLSEPYNVESRLFPMWVKRKEQKLHLQFPDQTRWGSEVEEYDETYIRSCLPGEFTWDQCVNLCSDFDIIVSDGDLILDINKYRNYVQDSPLVKLKELAKLSHIGLVTSPESARTISEWI